MLQSANDDMNSVFMTQISYLITNKAIPHHFHRNTLEIRILIQVFAYRNTGINIKIRISTLDKHGARVTDMQVCFMYYAF